MSGCKFKIEMHKMILSWFSTLLKYSSVKLKGLCTRWVPPLKSSTIDISMSFYPVLIWRYFVIRSCLLDHWIIFQSFWYFLENFLPLPPIIVHFKNTNFFPVWRFGARPMTSVQYLVQTIHFIFYHLTLRERVTMLNVLCGILQETTVQTPRNNTLFSREYSHHFIYSQLFSSFASTIDFGASTRF